jgi:hypothetical protein
MNIPSIPLVPAPESEDAKAAIGFKWAGDPIGKRHRIGGEPDWIQGEDVPSCACGENMTFYGQLDSVGDAVCMADCGMIYVFICFNCFETKSVFQCY